MDYSVLDYSLILTVFSFAVYGFGYLHNSFTPSKQCKDEYYKSGLLFCAGHIFLSILAFLFIRYIYSSAVNLVINTVFVNIQQFGYELFRIIWLLISFLLYIVAAYYTLNSLKSVIDVWNSDLNLFVDKEAVKNKFSNYQLCSYIFISVTLAHIIHPRPLHANTEVSTMFLAALIFTTILLILVIAILDGYKSSKYQTVIVKMKDKTLVRGRILKHGDHLNLLVNNKHIKINNECIYSIEDATSE